LYSSLARGDNGTYVPFCDSSNALLETPPEARCNSLYTQSQKIVRRSLRNFAGASAPSFPTYLSYHSVRPNLGNVVKSARTTISNRPLSCRTHFPRGRPGPTEARRITLVHGTVPLVKRAQWGVLENDRACSELWSNHRHGYAAWAGGIESGFGARCWHSSWEYARCERVCCSPSGLKSWNA
jgi:hypothetical protein